MTATEVVTAAGVFLALLWNVLNEIRLREHSKALQTNEAHLRVRAEMQLRLHQHAWDLLRETQAAAFGAFEATRQYQLQALAAQRGATTIGEIIFGPAQQAAQGALQKFSGLAHVAPPERRELRDAASAFSKAFNQIHRSLLGEPEAASMESTMTAITDALSLAAVGTKAWNEELWQHQTLEELAPMPKALKARTNKS